MTDPVVALSGGLLGLLVTLSGQAEAQGSVTAGIIVFAVGILVGLSCVVAMNYHLRRQQAREHEQWVQQGRPERRAVERRGTPPRVGA